MFIDHIWMEFKRLWSIRVALGGVAFWSAVLAIAVMWPAFADVLPLWVYAATGVVLFVAVGIARFLKQPGVDEL